MNWSVVSTPHPSGIFYSGAAYRDRNSNTVRYDSISPRHIQSNATLPLPFPGTSRCHAF